MPPTDPRPWRLVWVLLGALGIGSIGGGVTSRLATPASVTSVGIELEQRVRALEQSEAADIAGTNARWTDLLQRLSAIDGAIQALTTEVRHR